MEEIENMTLVEYSWRMQAYRIKYVNNAHDLHLQAYLNNVATATVKEGKDVVSKYPKFSDLFNYDEFHSQVVDGKKLKPKKMNEMNQLMLKANSKKGGI